ncbi:MAG: MBOAT family protein [Desulfobacteraceae bacterium]|nr:MBOAT family protein [Desulfobacteraceae bacterium]
MLFNSPVYLFLFLPITIVIFFFLNKYGLTTFGKIFLVAASLFFYSYWNRIYLFLIIGSVLVNYCVSQGMAGHYHGILSFKGLSNKILLYLGVVFNLGLLGFFKYADFFILNINHLTGQNIKLLQIALPLAISFFTFQQIAYLVDGYYHNSFKTTFLDYCLFVTFFPQLIAGPIVHHKEMLPQFAMKQNKILNWKNMNIGLFLFSIGLFKKTVIADGFSIWANAGYAVPANLTVFEAWCTSLSYTFQLYFDFSGYTDMALGSAYMLNIKLPLNFNSPYKAVNIQDFWRRWHMTLSRWLKNYLYVPLGGNRAGNYRTYQNLFLTFLLGGLWHGAAWTFVAWGALHGLGSMVHRLWSKRGLKMPLLFGWITTFLFVHFAWVFFRADTFSDALSVITSMLGFNGIKMSSGLNGAYYAISQQSWLKQFWNHWNFILPIDALIYMVFFGLVAFLMPNSQEFLNKDRVAKKVSYKLNYGFSVLTGLLISISLSFILMSSESEFLYFNF